MKTGFITLIVTLFISDAIGQIIKKYDSSLNSLPMVIKQYYVRKIGESSKRARDYIGFAGTDKGFYLTNKELKNYFIQVPESYEIYKRARFHFTLGKAVGLGSLGLIVTSIILSKNKASTPLAISGLVSFMTGFIISAQGRKIIIQAIPVYNNGIIMRKN